MSPGAPLGPKQRFEILFRDGFACVYCGARSPEARLHVDHVVARANGGGNDDDNLVTACEPCNLGKRVVQLPPRWRRIREFALAGMIIDEAFYVFRGDVEKGGLYDLHQIGQDEEKFNLIMSLMNRQRSFRDVVSIVTAAVEAEDEVFDAEHSVQ